MMTQTQVLAVLAFASAVYALPQAAPSVIGEPSIIDTTKITIPKGGAIAIADFWQAQTAPAPTDAPSLARRVDAAPKLDARAPSQLTISIVNQFGNGILTAHAQNAGGPNIISGSNAKAVLNNGASDKIVVPIGWAGNIAVVENGGRDIVGDESLIEASFMYQGGSSPVIDIDVSYVNGFSLPITCSCDGKTPTGCNKYLWSLGKCPDDNGKGSCRNSARYNDLATAALPFFTPCQHSAFTYPRDPGANANGICTSGTVTCCVGTSCAKNPAQPA